MTRSQVSGCSCRFGNAELSAAASPKYIFPTQQLPLFKSLYTKNQTILRHGHIKQNHATETTNVQTE
jgi:hypothetical protein